MNARSVAPARSPTSRTVVADAWRSGRLTAYAVFALVVALAPAVWLSGPWNAPAAVALVVVWGYLFLIARSWRSPSSLDLPLALFVLLLGIATPVIADWGEAIPRLLGVLFGLTVAYALAHALRSLPDVERCFTGLAIIGGFAAVLLALTGTAWQGNKLLPLESVYDHLPRLVRGLAKGTASGAFHPNQIAAMLAMVLQLVIGALLLSFAMAGLRGRLLRGGLLVVSALLVLGLVLTQSRTGLIAAATGSLVLLVLRIGAAGYGERHPWLVRWLAPIAITAVVVLSTVALVGWIQRSADRADTLSTRIGVWASAVQIIRAFPITGVGIGQYPVASRLLFPPIGIPADFSVEHPHNLVLYVVAEHGVPGALVVGWIFVACFVSLRRSHRAIRSPQSRTIAAAIAAALTSYLMFGVTDVMVLGSRGAVVLWLLIGLVLALERAVSLSGRERDDHCEDQLAVGQRMQFVASADPASVRAQSRANERLLDSSP